VRLKALLKKSYVIGSQTGKKRQPEN